MQADHCRAVNAPKSGSETLAAFVAAAKGGTKAIASGSGAPALASQSGGLYGQPAAKPTAAASGDASVLSTIRSAIHLPLCFTLLASVVL